MFRNVKFTPSQKQDLQRIVASLIFFLLGVFLPVGERGKFFIYLISYLIVAYPILGKAASNIRHGQIFDENFLMSIATIGAFLLGEYAEGVFVMLFYSVGELFQSLSVGKSRESIAALLEYAPEEARVMRGGEEEVVDPDEVEVGECIIVRAGEKIPLDGIIRKGRSSLNMSFLTGESIPVDVAEGAIVYSGSINNSGVLEIEVTQDYDNSTIAHIMELIEDSTAKKSKMENFITRFARVYTPVVVLGAVLVALLPPLILGGDFTLWVRRALNFLVISCPCALVVSIPIAFVGGMGASSKIGVLTKGSNYLEALAMVDTIAFDKTGTLTKGNFAVVEEISLADTNWREVLGALESHSNHPIAQSVANEYGTNLKDEMTNVEEIHGMGLIGEYRGEEIAAGNDKLMKKLNITPGEAEGVGTKINVAMGGALAGVVLVADEIKAESAVALDMMRDRGVSERILLTGDKKNVAEDVGEKLGLTAVYGELVPEDKVEKMEEILARRSTDDSKVAFVGDGMNDAPVLMRADVGIAMGALGSDVAIESADIVLMDDNLDKIPETMDIAKKTVRIAKQNAILSLGVKGILLILSVFGLVDMWLAIFGDVGVMMICVINALRIMNFTPANQPERVEA